MRRVICILAVLLLLSGCSLFGGNVPEGFSRGSYDDMVEAYRAYEQQKIDNEASDVILTLMFDYRKSADEGKLTEAEMTARDLISQLTIAYSNAHNGLTNETYDLANMSPNSLTVEIGATLKIEDIKDAETEVMAYLDIEPLPVPEKEEQLKREALKKASSRILNFTSFGENATPYGYEDSYVVYRKDRDEYYIASAFRYDDISYKYDMILDGELNFVDAYMIDDIAGILSKPMNDDNRPVWAKDIAEAEPEQAEENSSGTESVEISGEEEESEIMNDIYGSEKDIYIDANGAHSSEETEEQPDSDLPVWDKSGYFGGTLTDLAAILSGIRIINDEAMSLSLDVESGNTAVMTLSELRSQLEFMTLDPATNVHFSQTELDMTQQILGSLDAVIQAEQQMISDPSSQNIRLADSLTEEAQSLIDIAKSSY